MSSHSDPALNNNQKADRISNEGAFIFPFSLSSLSYSILAQNLSPGVYADEDVDRSLIPAEIAINSATFVNSSKEANSSTVAVVQEKDQLIISCTCGDSSGKLCSHKYTALVNLLKREDFRVFFDEKLRHETLKKFAEDYGLANEDDLDQFFDLTHSDGKTKIITQNASLLPVTQQSLATLKHKLQNGDWGSPLEGTSADGSVQCIILKQHKYYRHLYIELIEAQSTREGKLKNPFIPVNPLEEIWKTEDPQVIKFYSAIRRFQNNIDEKITAADTAYLKAVISNPLGLPVYVHSSEVSENISAASVQPVHLSVLKEDVALAVDKKGRFYEVSGSLKIGEKTMFLSELRTRFQYFVQLGDHFFLAKSTNILTLMDLFRGKGKSILIHQSKFEAFKEHVLSELELKLPVEYKYLKEATVTQLEQTGFNAGLERIIYLSDFGQHISIVPVIKYGEVEVPVRSKRQIVAADEKGKQFTVKRNNAIEDNFIALLLKQHADFNGQLDNPLQYFYLHKKRFLNEDWFLKAFEDWQAAGITILGFDEITENKLNPEIARISVQVTSGVNWFNTDIDLRFGKKRASLKQLRQSIKSKSRFVKLDDGTMGIIPSEWIQKFAAWFSAAEVTEDTLRTPRVSFASIAELYEETVLSEEVKFELVEYNRKLSEYKEIKPVTLPASLKAVLRPYQQHGLNWLNFLDEFNFGGCLADDMGLGKSVQIIAFILSQREKRGMTTNMIVVPTSLIFNWQAEIEKFAPSLKVHTAYGSSRTKSVGHFDQFEVILTSYGTLLSDITYFKKFHFNYVFFDESQNIKNPQSQRYMAARSLNARSKVVITGTPIENNTFDLYGQLSVACPGLLGNLTYFRDVYSSPIDKFGVKKRAAELQKKIEPFILRRTKDQVAPELPEKIEMVIYCEMGPAQRKVYNAYEKEIRDFISSKSDEDLSKTSMHVLKGITKLRQICDAPSLAGEKDADSRTSSKIETLITHIEDGSSGHKILVFSQFVTMLDLIRDQLDEKEIQYSYLTGRTKNREAVINEFQDNPNIRVFLISLKAGGTGLNLTEANYVYIVDPWWNPAVENQAIDRCYRIGQKKNVVAVRLICPDTVEEKIMKLQQSKTDRMNDLIKADSSMLKSMSRTDLMNLFSNK